MAGKEAGTEIKKENGKEAEAGDMGLHPLEQMRDEMKVSEAVHAGTCIMMGWRRGKKVARKEYAAAVGKFKRSAAGRGKDA